MKKTAFLGGGKIGRSMLKHVQESGKAEVMFVYDPFLNQTDIDGVPVVSEVKEKMLKGLDLVVECANADVVSQFIVRVMKYTDFMPFSMTAFRDDALRASAKAAAEENGHTIYLPHGAILGLDGIFDGRSELTEVTIETIKSPASLGRNDTEYTVLYDGPSRKATELYPRNVNVHAAIALAGIGFDKTHSRIIADPSVNTNTHLIHLLGKGIDFTIRVSSFSEGGVTGKYTPLSACGSLDRVLGGTGFQFV